jgi:hypothetical protein
MKMQTTEAIDLEGMSEDELFSLVGKIVQRLKLLGADVRKEVISEFSRTNSLPANSALPQSEATN